MAKLDDIYSKAVNHTKNKVINDIETFFTQYEDLPSLSEYIEERSTYIQQIWRNIWVNKVTGAYSLKEKRTLLLDEGMINEELGKSAIKKLFKDKVKDLRTFNVEQWLHEKFSTQSKAWEEIFLWVKQSQRKQIEKQKHIKLIHEAETRVIDKVNEFFHEQFEDLYIYIRYRVAKKISKELQGKPKYKIIGKHWQNERLAQDGFLSEKAFQKVEDFFNEYTGDIVQFNDWGRLYYDYEVYGELYEKRIFEFTIDGLMNVFQEFTTNVRQNYYDFTRKNLSTEQFNELIVEVVFEFVDEAFEQIQDECMIDLLQIVDIPFSLPVHQKIWHEHKALREERRRQEEFEIQKKKEEEERIIADVFGKEFLELVNRPVKYILHIGDTNTGKTYHALEAMKRANTGCYLGPLRLLALEVFEKLNNEGVPCSLKTGEEEKRIEHARHISSTVEMFHEKDEHDCIVIDESQMIADKERGFSWYKAITTANAKEVHIIGSKNSKEMLLSLLGDAQIVMNEYERDTPLVVENKPFRIDKAKKGDALICFSRKKVLETAAYLEQRKIRVSIIYGSMPPETRRAQIERFIQGETSVVVATDAIGMGLNLPIRRVVFLENEKFDGTKRRRLTSQEVKQIAGRAGRKGIYEVGKVAFQSEMKTMKTLLEKEDVPLKTFTVSPTSAMFERFQKYSHQLGTFFKLWDRFVSPKGTLKSTLAEEKELYSLVEGTEIEARLSLIDLYGFLHLPFSKREKQLIDQWLETMKAIISGQELPEPIIKTSSLDEIELSYKAIGLHLLFLYHLDRPTEAAYWERIRTEISEEAGKQLRKEVKHFRKTCRKCGRKLPYNHPYPICDHCYLHKYEYWS